MHTDLQLKIINFSNSKIETNNYLGDFTDTFSLTNIVNSKTCFKCLNGTLLDIMLTNKPNVSVKLVPLKQASVFAQKCNLFAENPK